jgi:hypothetical protein
MIAASIGLDLKADQVEEALQCAAHGGIVVDDCTRGFSLLACCMPSAMHP